MPGRGAGAALKIMSDRRDDLDEHATDRFERRLIEEGSKLRVEIVTLRADMNAGFGQLRAETIERNAQLLQWFLVFAVTQTGVIVGVIALFR